MLELLSMRKGTTLTKEMFLNNLYGGMDEPEIKIIDVFICKLRKKLANASDGKDYIGTVRGRGYILREPSGGEPRIALPSMDMTARVADETANTVYGGMEWEQSVYNVVTIENEWLSGRNAID